MKSKDVNTFGNYEFPSWVPIHNQEIISDFWGIFGRTHKDWIQNGERSQSDSCNHGPELNGFGNPPFGATADYIVRCYKASEEYKENRFKIVRGRYIHHWNNIGAIIDENGESHSVSSCDRWVRVWRYGERKQ